VQSAESSIFCVFYYRVITCEHLKRRCRRRRWWRDCGIIM